MIKYNLICKCGKTFESWFPSSNEFDVLKRKKLVKCIYCDSTAVKKTVMSPNLFSFCTNLQRQCANLTVYILVERAQGALVYYTPSIV